MVEMKAELVIMVVVVVGMAVVEVEVGEEDHLLVALVRPNKT